MYKSIIEEDPSNKFATNNLAQLLVDEYDDESSHKLALELVKRIKLSDNLAIQDTIGWVYSQNALHDEAISMLSLVVEKSPDTAIFKYHLGMVYYRKGDDVNAKQYLNEAISMNSKQSWYKEAQQILDSISK